METIPKPEIAGIEIAPEQPSLTYKLDLEKGRISGLIDGGEAAAQAIGKAILTKRYKSLIYDSQYGSEVSEIIGAKDASKNLIKSEIDYYVKDALKSDARFLSVEKVECEAAADYADVYVSVNTVFGEQKGEVRVVV